MDLSVTQILGTFLLLKEIKPMFGKTHSVVLTLVDEVPTAIASVKEETLVGGVLASITSDLSSDTVVIGMGRTIGTALKIAVPMYLTNFKLTGRFHVNPLSAA
jgi:hypothetical protein